MPVSYTHLDVYKRQEFNYAREALELGSFNYALKPVSYTHLDVYKRQPSKFGYKDLCQLWKAENFDPEGLMDLYYKAGARYFICLLYTSRCV